MFRIVTTILEKKMLSITTFHKKKPCIVLTKYFVSKFQNTAICVRGRTDLESAL